MTDPFAGLPEPEAPTRAPLAKSSSVDETMDIRFTNFERADRAKRQAIAAIESCETLMHLKEYVREESLLFDAIDMFDGAMTQDIDDAIETQKAILGATQITTAEVQVSAKPKRVTYCGKTGAVTYT